MPTDSISPIDVIQHLCLEAGRLMEDTSVELALLMPAACDDRTARLECLGQATDDIAALSAAAEVLHRRGSA